MMFFRKSLQAALVAAIFCQLFSFVESHCFNPDGSYAHPGHYIAECFHPPTTSPAPTASPAPSPSPSEPPSYSLGPSASPAPTTSPTDAPTTSIPSSRPSASPTASPAPSPSPSGIPSASPTKSAAPSVAPTMKPSQSPSDHPSASPSEKPSMNPSESPTEQPSASPTTSSPSASPTGPITLTVLDLGFVLQNVTGEREMSVQDIAFLESVTTYYLQSHVDGAPGALSLEVDYAIITDQNLIKFENQTDLLITIDIVVSAIWNQSESLMLNDFFQEFFAMAEHKKEIRDIVEQDESFAAGIFVTMATESPTGSPTESPTVSSNESSFESSVDQSKSQKKERKAPNRSAVTGSILAVIAVFVGAWLLWMWMHARKYDETGDLKLWTWIQEQGDEFWKWSKARGNEFWKWSQTRGKELQKWSQVRRNELSKWIQGQRNTESEDLKLDNVGTISNKSSDSSEDRRLSISNFYPKRDIESAESNENSENSVNDDGRERKSNMVPLMFVPTLLPTESNIEIPDTPGSTVPFSGFETPSSTAGFMNGFATPKSTRSGNFATSKLLGQTPDSEESKAKLPVMPKIPLPPKVLGPPKSPYRRETKGRGQIESHDNGSSMYSGVGVVAGKNNRDESDKNNLTQAEMILQDLPMEIGGPSSTAPKPAAKLPRPKVVIPTQEDIVFRPPSGRKGSRYAYSPRLNPHPRKKKGESTTRSTEKDHSVVDIVDQIAYLYSSNEPEKRTDTDTKN